MLDEDLAAWDIPVTDEFLDGVRRGVRRRRRVRGAAAGAVLLAVAAIAAMTIAVAGPFGLSEKGTQLATPATPVTAASASDPALDGFRITRLPAGTVRVGPDSSDAAAVTPEGLRYEGNGPAGGQAWATVSLRRFDRGVGVGVFVSVLRPRPGTNPTVKKEIVADWLVNWSSGGGAPIRTFHVQSGTARLFAHAGTEVTAYQVIITTPDHIVITIGGNARFTPAELETMAEGITG